MLLPIDMHTHLNAPSAGKIKVINGTSPDDWEHIAALARWHPDSVIPAFGLHPWKLYNIPPDWTTTLKAFLTAFPHSLLGEIGLDKTRENEFPLSLQEEFFLTQWRLARSLSRPVVLHCVKAWHRLLPLLESPPHRFLCHAFNGGKEIIAPLVKKGAYFSLGPRELCSPKAKSTLSLIPEDKFLLESDGSPPEELFPAIENIASALGIPTDKFIEQATRNGYAFLSGFTSPSPGEMRS